MTPAVPLAVVGAGAIGRSHVERILRTPGVVLAGVAESGEAGRQWCAERQLPCYPDHHALLRAARPAGAIIATPNATHVAVAADFLAAGVPVLVEKPIADSLHDAARLVHLQRETGIPVLVGHHRRHNPVVQRAREWIADGRLGRVVAATVLAAFYKPDAYFDLAWRREPGGGPVLINLIHDIDLLLFLLGDARSVQAQASNAVRQFAVEDTASALITFASGALATVIASDTAVAPWNWDLCAGEQAHYPRQPVQTHFFMGTQASLTLPDLALWRYPGERHWHQELAREQAVMHARDPFELQLANFLAVIAGRQEPVCSALDGWRTLQATVAVLEASRSGATVACAAGLPERP